MFSYKEKFAYSHKYKGYVKRKLEFYFHKPISDLECLKVKKKKKISFILIYSVCDISPHCQQMNAISFVPSKDNAISEIWYVYDVFKMMQLSNWTKNILNIKNIQHKYLAIPINSNICMEGVHVKDPRKPWEKEWCFGQGLQDT